MNLILQAIKALLRGLEKRINQAIPAPETAKAGQMIVVKAVDENGKPTEWEAVDMPEVPKQANADWNQNDHNAPDYVKNRPFYEETTVEDISIELVAGATTDVSADLCAKLFEHRKTATYIIDGKPASFVRDHDVGIPYNIPYWEILVDNGSLCHVYFDGIRGEMLSSWYDGHDGTYLSGEISVTIATVSVQQLDEKFIPDTIARTGTGTEATCVVNVTFSGNTYSADKTSDEIKQALYDGRLVFLHNASNGDMHVPLSRIYYGNAEFRCSYQGGGDVYYVYGDGSVSYSAYSN